MSITFILLTVYFKVVFFNLWKKRDILLKYIGIQGRTGLAGHREKTWGPDPRSLPKKLDCAPAWMISAENLVQRLILAYVIYALQAATCKYK